MKILRKLVSSDAVSFGAVVKAKHLVHGYVSDTVVVKKLLEVSVDHQREFIKEARMLHSLQHENVVSFKVFCQRPFAIILEYICFDFSALGLFFKVKSTGSGS